MFRYISRICRFVYRSSRTIASSASRSFRPIVFFGERKKFFASCWVIVEPPWANRRSLRLASTARPIPRKSIPAWEKNRASSAAITAF
ncbi:MAG: hypothetical protein A2Z26_00760 [Deltaproteobacteria bacterium RBG_16_66_15]|nr:MAG: hypothetical protein A2Z26_00760 [Deltaproteobacteria bacterium RBG_16_66_15]